MRKVVVLMGGQSREQDVSRVTGTAVAKALAERGHQVTLLDTRDGVQELTAAAPPVLQARPPAAHVPAAAPGAETLPAAVGSRWVQSVSGAFEDVDAVFIALHGGWGEDGTLQAFFDLCGVPYTGSGLLASALAMDKERSKRMLRSIDLPTPDWRLIEWDASAPPCADCVRAMCAELEGDLVVKPNAEGSTVGLTIVAQGEDPFAAVQRAARHGERVLVECFVPGRELTVAVLGNEPLPVVEIHAEGGIYDYEAKYTAGGSRYEVPADLPAALATRIREDSLAIYRLLGCAGFARIDWRLDPQNRHWFLECNTVPGMTPLSLVPMAAQAAGIPFAELVERLVDDAVARAARRPQTPSAEEEDS